NDELVVGNSNNASITVYPRTASGNAGFIRRLSGAATGLGVPSFLAVPSNGRRDFNGDAHADIVWRHSSGALAMWFMNGGSVIGSSVFGAVGSDWTLVGVGDFDGDGRADLLWRHTSGTPAIWLMSGTTLLTSAVLTPVGTDWTVDGVADCNGDGRADII